jgi:hypothetical protein
MELYYTVQALVNVGRVKLADGLGLELPDSIDREKEMWGLVTKYTYYAEEVDAQKLDQFRKKVVMPDPITSSDPGENDDEPAKVTVAD